MRKYFELVIELGMGRSSLVKVPLRTAQRVILFGGLIGLVAVVSLGGWLMSRWRLHQAVEHLGAEKMKNESLEARLKDLLSNSNQADPNASVSGVENELTLYPSLGESEYLGTVVGINDLKVELFASKKEIQIQFDLVKNDSLQIGERFYLVGLLHGAQGVLHLPPTLASRKGDPILFHRGWALNEVKNKKSFRQNFNVGDFLEKASGEPLFFSLLIFDNKGSLVFRKRTEPTIRRLDSGRAKPVSAEGDTR